MLDPNTKLIQSIQTGALKDVTDAIKGGANIVKCIHDAPNAFGSTKWSALHYAAYLGQTEIISELLLKKIDINILSVEIPGASHYFCKYFLLGQFRKQYNVTPLYLASLNNQSASVKLLLEAGADFTIPTNTYELIDVTQILQCLNENLKLNTIDLQDFKIHSDNYDLLKTALCNNQHLKLFKANKINPKNLQSILTELVKNKNIERITLPCKINISESRGKYDQNHQLLLTILQTIRKLLQACKNIKYFDFGEVCIQYNTIEEAKECFYNTKFQTRSYKTVTKTHPIFRLDTLAFSRLNRLNDVIEQANEAENKAHLIAGFFSQFNLHAKFPTIIDAKCCFDEISKINALIRESDSFGENYRFKYQEGLIQDQNQWKLQ